MIRAAALLAALLAGAPPASAALVEKDLSLRIDPERRTLAGEARLTVPAGPPVELALGARFAASDAAVDGRPLAGPRRDRGRWLWTLPSSERPREVKLRWSGALERLDTALEHRDTLRDARPAAGGEGTFLPAASGWYPEVAGQPFRYRVRLALPAGQRGLVPGRLVREEAREGEYRATFEFPHPAEGIDLMAGPYRVEERFIRGAAGGDIRLRTYFHPRIADLAGGYLDALKRYFDIYEAWIGPYPYTEFSVVSSPTPTGFGMPALTYLGVDVLRLPFIKDTSLGHEVLHNWWGNGVYPDYRSGNWAEGLTTFMADYAYKERAGADAAREMRLSWLRDFAAIPPGEDRPLTEFTSRRHGTSQIVGYHKAAMVFLMLRDRIGSGRFDAGVRRFWETHRFRTASWDDLRRAFEAASGEDLSPFFDQWLARAGAPAITLAGAERTAAGVRIELEQTQPAYRLRVPVTIRTAAGDQTEVLSLTTTRASVEVKTSARAETVALDPEFRLLRRLGAEEAPPILRDAMVNPRTATVIAGGDAALRDAASQLAQRMLDYPSPPADAPRGDAPVLLIGVHADVDAWLARNGWPPRPPEVGHTGSLQTWTARRDDGRVLAAVSAAGAGAVQAAARALPHYGRQSFLAFEGSRAVAKGVWPAQPQAVKVAPAR